MPDKKKERPTRAVVHYRQFGRPPIWYKIETFVGFKTKRGVLKTYGEKASLAYSNAIPRMYLEESGTALQVELTVLEEILEEHADAFTQMIESALSPRTEKIRYIRCGVKYSQSEFTNIIRVMKEAGKNLAKAVKEVREEEETPLRTIEI